MKPCVFFMEKESDGTIITTKDEILKMISLAYEQGVEDGKKQNSFPVINPVSFGGETTYLDMTTSTAKPYNPERFCEVTAENANHN